MPSRTEIVISFGEIIECLPPGKQRRKRYASFDANVGNEENLDPSSINEPCDIMKPEQNKKVSKSRSKCDDTDDEISFRDGSRDIDTRSRPSGQSCPSADVGTEALPCRVGTSVQPCLAAMLERPQWSPPT